MERVSMRIIPVLDVMNGKVVRAVGGKRENYRPIVSKLTKSTEPLDVLKALNDVTGSDVAYVADLDAIVNETGPSKVILDLLDKFDITLWMDFGIRSADDLQRISIHQRLLPVIGSETIHSFEVAAVARQRFPAVVGSIDLFDGIPLGTHGLTHADDVAAEFCIAGFDAFILLDLSAVGNGRTKHHEIISNVVRAVEPSPVFVGGGIRNRDDVRRYQDAGAAGVLVASALHDGTLA
jgi:phosphoribosylformimino-5-aminoimidazole carboxamide ribotide isomerase